MTSGGHQLSTDFSRRERERRLSGGGESPGLEGGSRSRSATTGQGGREAKGSNRSRKTRGPRAATSSSKEEVISRRGELPRLVGSLWRWIEGVESDLASGE